ncbi:MAG: M12 family metallo-peptidase [Salinivenus sp.]
MAGCDTTATQQDSQDDSSEELASRVQEVLGSQVGALQIREIQVGQVAQELEAGETTLPLVTPDNEVIETTFQTRPANLRPDSVDTGILREGPDTHEEVPLPPEQSYVLGERENVRRIGGITILDEAETMLRGVVRHSDYGLSYIQSVNHLLRTDDYPNRHVIYNVANTEDFDIQDGEAYPSEGTNDARRGGGAKLNVDEPASVVLDGDVDFYTADKNTVWRRQESLFLATQLADGFIEPLSSDTWRLDLSIAGQEVWVSGGPSTTDNGDLMNELEDPSYYLIHSLSEKQMHLFLVGYDVNGLAGRAGGIGSPSGGWGGGSGDNHLFSEALSSRSLHVNRLVLTHEVGHLIGGHHGNSITSGCSGSMCGRSIMNHTITRSQEYFYSNANDGEISDVIDAVLP